MPIRDSVPLEKADEGAQAQIDTVIAAFGMRRTGPAWAIQLGTLNHNFRVPTQTGRVFARNYRPGRSTAQILAEHELIRWGRERGLPAMAPLATADGETIVHAGREHWARFLWVDGRVPVRGRMSAAQVRALGALQGRTHAVLAAHPRSTHAEFSELGQRLAWDSRRSLHLLDRLDAAAMRAGDAPPIRAALVFQRSLLEQGRSRPFRDFAALPVQLLHGDYHDQQVLLDADDRIVALVDWRTRRSPSASGN